MRADLVTDVLKVEKINTFICFQIIVIKDLLSFQDLTVICSIKLTFWRFKWCICDSTYIIIIIIIITVVVLSISIASSSGSWP